MTARFLLDTAHTSPVAGRGAGSESGDGRSAHGTPDLADWLAFARGETPLPTVLPDAFPAEETAGHRLVVPEHYEPNYSYPLVVWMLNPGQSIGEFREIARGVSDRNYITLAFRPQPAAAGAPALVDEQRLLATVADARAEYNIHVGRVFLAGFDAGAGAALRLALKRPEWFAGMAAFGAGLPAERQLLNRFRDLRCKRVLIGTGAADETYSPARLSADARLLHAAGLRLCTRVYDCGHELAPLMLRDLDRWIMREIYQPTP